MPTGPDSPRPNPAFRLPKHVPRTPGDYGRGHLKVDNMLREEDRDAYLALLRQPGTTGRKAYEWLVARGYKVGRGAVKHHKRRFDEKLRTVRTSAEMSLACAELVRQVGANKMSDAAVLQFETLLTETLFHREQGKPPGKEEWDMLGRALTNAVTNRTRVETVRMATEEAKRRAEKSAGPSGRKPFDGIAVANAVRRRFGVPPPPALPPPGSPAPLERPAPADSAAPVPPLPSAGEGGGEGERHASDGVATQLDSGRSPSP